MGSEPASEVTVAFRSSLDIEAWPQRHARGEVPDAWPYGLDKLAEFAGGLHPASLPEPGRWKRATARTRTRRAPAPDGTRQIGIAWDEHMAHRMLVLAPKPEMHSGAIWVTDLLAANPRDATAARQLRTLRQMDGIFVNSRAQLEVLEHALTGSDTRLSFLPFGIDADFFSPAPYPERPLLVSCGGDRDRDPATLFEALAQVHAARPDVEIVVQSTSQATPPAGVQRVPRMTHSELAALYRRATAVVVATRPNLHMSGLTVSLESMATARPVVLTATPGVDDYFRDGDTALLATVADAASVADRVLTLLGDPAAAAAMGVRARAQVEARFTTTHLARAIAAAVGLPGAVAQ